MRTRYGGQDSVARSTALPLWVCRLLSLALLVVQVSTLAFVCAMGPRTVVEVQS